MNIETKERFMRLWEKYFDGARLPIVFYYTDNEKAAARVKPPAAAHRCVFADIARVAAGRSLMFDADSVRCFGGKHYLGFSQEYKPDFEYFLSCGKPAELEGERYKKTPKLVKSYMKEVPEFNAPAKYIVFKRWDKIDADEKPEVVVFFAAPDVLSGLFTLANYDRPDLDGVCSPFGAGCATIVLYPYKERDAQEPRGIMGVFDVSARPFIRPHHLSFAVPMNRFMIMMDNMEESFLTTKSWAVVRKRIASEARKKS